MHALCYHGSYHRKQMKNPQKRASGIPGANLAKYIQKLGFTESEPAEKPPKSLSHRGNVTRVLDFCVVFGHKMRLVTQNQIDKCL